MMYPTPSGSVPQLVEAAQDLHQAAAVQEQEGEERHGQEVGRHQELGELLDAGADHGAERRHHRRDHDDLDGEVGQGGRQVPFGVLGVVLGRGLGDGPGGARRHNQVVRPGLGELQDRLPSPDDRQPIPGVHVRERQLDDLRIVGLDHLRKVRLVALDRLVPSHLEYHVLVPVVHQHADLRAVDGVGRGDPQVDVRALLLGQVDAGRRSGRNHGR